MKIAFVSDEHFPFTGADTEVIVNTAASLGRLGAEVTLVVPRLRQPRRIEEIGAFYGVPASFRIAHVPGWPVPSRQLRVEKLFHGLLSDLHPAIRKADVVHSRDLLPLAVARFAGLPWSFETYRRHAMEKPWLPRLLKTAHLERGVGAVAHSEACRVDLIRLGFPEAAVVTARPGFAPERFEPVLTRGEARQRIGLAERGRIVAYTGNIHVSKGMDQLLELAGRLADITFVVVGGSPSDVGQLAAGCGRSGLHNVLLVGHRRPTEVVPYLYAADVLFVPHALEYVHPGWLAEKLPLHILPGTPFKLYAYMAAGRPIVSTDRLITRELLHHEDNALLFPPDDLACAAQSIRRLCADSALSERLSRCALETVKTFTWEARAKTMLSFFEKRLSLRGR
jgi:glycosyltransferase involved in cell wall biosynthesis